MRIIVVALFALVLVFQLMQLASACKCGCGCGCHCGSACGCGCGGCSCGHGYGYGHHGYGHGYGCGCGACGGYNNHLHHVVHSTRSECAAPSVVGIPVLSSLGVKGCGCRGACTCGRSSCWDD